MGRRDEEEKLLRHNSVQIEKYLEFRDVNTQKGTAGSSFNLENCGKPESEPPMSERGHIVCSVDDNRHFDNHVGWILANIRNKPIFRTAILLEFDPTALRRWRKEETEHEKEQLRKFRRLCKFVATQIEKAYPGLKLFYHINPKEEEVETPRQYNDKRRTWDRHESYMLIGAEVERVMREEGCGVQAAKGLVSQRTNRQLGTPCSFPRVDAAWLYYQNHRKGVA